MKIFFSYAPEDTLLFRDFERSLELLKKVEGLEFTNSHMSLPHENVNEVVSNAMLQADLIFVLLSDDYFSTISCAAELKLATQWHKQNQKIMLCLLLRPCLWDITGLQDFKVLPENAKAVSTWKNIDEVHTDIALSLKNVIDKYQANADYRPAVIEAEEDKRTLLQNNNQLVNYPRPQMSLINQEKKIQQFGEFFTPNSATKSRIISVEGLGGIGKTSFVANCIEKYIKDKKRIVWLDIDENTTFNDFVEQAGYGFLVQNNKTKKAKYVALKTHLEAEKKILFWNNFQVIEDKEFKDFLFTVSTTLEYLQIVIISRFKPKLKIPIASIQLYGLNEEEALKYAFYVQKMDSDYINIPQKEIEKLCKYTHGHILSIQLGMELLGYGETAEMVFESLKNHEHLYDNLLKAIFNHLQTTPKSKEVLFQMSAFRQKVTYEAITALNECNNLNTVLFPLIYKNILISTPSISGTLYELHPLVRHFCYHLLEDKKRIHTRAAAYFLQKREKLPNISIEKQIFYHLEKSEQFNKIGNTIELFGEALIVRGQHLFLEEMLETVKDKGFDIGMYQLLQGKIYNVKGNWKAAYQCFLQACKLSENSETMIEAYLNISTIFQRQGKIQEALKCCDNVEKYLDQKNILRLRALFFLHKNSIYLDLGDLKKATSFYVKGMQVCEKIEDKTTQIELLKSMGRILEQQGNFDKAMLKYEAALEKSREIKDDKRIGKVLNSMGSVYYKKNDLRKALLLFEESLEAKKKAGDLIDISNTMTNIGMMQMAQEQYEKALNTLAEVVKLTKDLGNKKALSSAFLFIGEVFYAQKEIKKALKFYQKALKLKKELQDKSGIAIVYHNMSKAVCDLQKNKFEAALQYNFNALLGFYQLGSKYLTESVDVYKKITATLEIEKIIEIEEEFVSFLDKNIIIDFYELRDKYLAN